MSDYYSLEEREVAESFFNTGYVIRAVEDKPGLDRLQRLIAETAAAYLDLPLPADVTGFLDDVHRHVTPEALNGLRLAVIQRINSEVWVRPTYFSLARRLVEMVVGNELCMQRRLNLSIQLPGDESSLLPVHADTWSGDSPFEVVVWLPLVDVYGTKTMYLASPAADRAVQDRLGSYASAEDIFQALKPDLSWIDMKFGQVMIFNQNLAHGNRVNEEPFTRWSMNCRFKAALTPYADKRIGEFFEPLMLRPATRIGMDFVLREAGDE